MTVLTGELFRTSIGNIIGFNKQEAPIEIGDKVSFDGNVYEVLNIIFSSRPPLRRSVKVRRIEGE